MSGPPTAVPSADAPPRRRVALAWAFYDWGNSAFSTTVMATLFPILFHKYWCAGAEPGLATLRLGSASSTASAIVLVLAPLIGALADAGRLRKPLLAGFALLGVTATAALWFVPSGHWWLAAALYTIATVGFLGANVPYDGLLVSVALPSERDRVSSLGYALGYLGGGLLFAVNVAMVLAPQAFGLPDKTAATRLAFVSVALWWAFFTLPLLGYVPEPPGGGALRGVVGRAARELGGALRAIQSLPNAGRFLLAYWLYIDAVQTIIVMAASFGSELGLPDSALIVALLITQFVGFPSAILFGRLGERLGTRTSLLVAIGVYLGVVVMSTMLTAALFYLLAAIVGLVQGAAQALSRSLFSRLVPASKAGEMFGFYNMLGKFAAVVGPLVVGLTSAYVGPRWSVLSLTVLLVAGGALLFRVDETRGRAEAERMERTLA
ncbi:MAG: MFS transporter [Polyangiaceae bacterium]|nr:MFS transporter [Polyangiaceae bacterium]